MKPVLRLQSVSFGLGNRKILSDVSFDVAAGRVTVLLGPNGAGKTSLFSMIARLLVPDRGDIFLRGESLRTAPAGVMSSMAIVFQQPALDLDLSVTQNLAYYSSLHGMPRAMREVGMHRVLTQLEMTHLSRTRVRNLNGGHRRRVEIARALMTRPTLLLLDEPTVGLDIPTRQSLVAFLHEVAVREDMAILWATHLIDEISVEDDLVVLAGGQVKAAGSVKAVLQRLGLGSLEAAYTQVVAA
jgi:ABC-2 type transport system ATP-binding protein